MLDDAKAAESENEAKNERQNARHEDRFILNLMQESAALETAQWKSILRAIERAPPADIAEWERIAEWLERRLTPAEREAFTSALRKAKEKETP